MRAEPLPAPYPVKVGTTVGLGGECSRELRRAEQVYVRRSDRNEDSTHPVEIDAWVGYESVARLRLTRRQTIELIGLLAEATR